MSELNSNDSENDEQEYISVSCDFVDLIEHFATRREMVKVLYRQADNPRVEKSAVIETWVNEGGIEYVVFSDGERLRMDHIIQLNEHQSDGDCKL